MDRGGEGQQQCILEEFRFHPTDNELMKDFLIPKLNGELIWEGIIREDMDVYQCQPADIPGIQTGSDFAYFFTERGRKHQKGSRPDRCTKDCEGFWKITSKINRIYDENDKKFLLGYKNTLVYYLKDLKEKNKHAKKASKTNWIMHEFVAAQTQDDASKRSSSSMILDGIVLCRIYERRKIKKEEESLQNHLPASVEDNHQQFVCSALNVNSQPDVLQPHDSVQPRQQFADHPTTTFYVDAWPLTEVNYPDQTYQLMHQLHLAQEQNFNPAEAYEQACDIELSGQAQAVGAQDPPMPLRQCHGFVPSISPSPDDINEFIAWYDENFSEEHHDLQVDNIESNQLPNVPSYIVRSSFGR